MASRGSFLAEFVGREEELVLLRAQLDEACAGAGSIALLAGEPGIGKTRTAQEVAADARLRGARVLWGRCYEGEGAPAYWPWIQILRAYVRDHAPPVLSAELGPGAADVAQLVPEIRQRLPGLTPPPPLDPAQARFRLFDSVTTFLVNAAARQPLALILDDLHWADQPSLLLLQFLARELRRTSLLVVGTYRDVEVGRRHPLAGTLAELAREQVSRRIRLRGLAEPQIARFIELAAGVEPPDALVAAVSRETEGNPFFVAELVRLLLDEGRLEHTEQAGAWDLTLPPSVREVIGRRLEHLSERCNEALAVAAVIGREFSLSTLAGASTLDLEALLEALEEAETARVVVALPRTPGRYTFGHALIRETLYEELPAARLARLHGLVGTALEALAGQDPDPHLAELAHHFFLAAPAGGAARAVAYARRAGDRAMALLAYEEAVGHYERGLQAAALQATRDVHGQCNALLALGDALRKAGELQRAIQTFQDAADLARKLGAPELLASAALGFEDAVLPAGIARGATRSPSVCLLEEALAALGEGNSAVKARVLAALARALCFSGARAQGAALSQQAVDLTRAVGDPAALAYALNARRIAIWGPDGPEERLAVASEIVRAAEDVGDMEMALEGHQWRQHVLVELGQIDAADAEIEAYARLAEALRQPLYLSYLALLRASRALLTGRFADVERLAQQAFAVGQRARSENVATVHLAQMLLLRREQGRLAELEGVLGHYAARFPVAWTYRSALVRLDCELGREMEAARAFERLAADDFADLPPGQFRLVNVAFLAEACAFLGEERRAARLHRLLLPYAAQNILGSSAGPCLGSASHYLGLLAATMRRWDDAAGHFEAALGQHARMEARPWLARTQYEYGRMLLARGRVGDRERAAGLLTEALGAARELGMARLNEQVIGLRTGGCERAAAAYPGGLTAREVEVLRRIAGGWSNREIADELVLSVRTVEHHVANVYAKIGARGRADATAYALRRGLAPPGPPQ